MKVKAYLEITMFIDPENRPAAAMVYTDYRQPFLDQIEGALTKELLIRDEDAQVIHGFDSMEHAKAYLESVPKRCFCRAEADLGGRPRCAFLRRSVNGLRWKSAAAPARPEWFELQHTTDNARSGQ